MTQAGHSRAAPEIHRDPSAECRKRHLPNSIAIIGIVLASDVLLATGVPILATLGALGLLLVPGFQLVRAIPATARLRSAWILGATASLTFMPLFFALVWNVLVTHWSLVAALNGLILLLLVATQIVQASSFADEAQSTIATRRSTFWYAAILIWTGLTVFCTFALPQLPARRQVVEIGDYVKHHALLMALEEQRLPLRSPFYAAAANEEYHYYHYAYFWPAALRQLSGGGVSRGIAFSIFAALVAMGFVATTFEIAKRFCDSHTAGVLAAACVSVVGGLDVIPQLIRVLSGEPAAAIMDSWIPSPWRIHNLATQYVWCSQHVLSLLVVLFACLFVGRRWNPWFWMIVTPLICVAVFGMSAFVSLTVLPAIAMTGAIEAIRLHKQKNISWSRLLGVLGVIALLSTLFAIPQLLGYLEARTRLPGEFTTQWPRLPWAVFGRIAPPGVLANWLDLPWIFVVDFGVAGLALLFAPRGFWRASWDHAGLRALLLAGVAGVIGTFTVHNNAHDFVYGFRVCAMALIPVGAVAAGAVFFGRFAEAARSKIVRPLLVVAGCLGLSIGLLEMPFMAFRALGFDTGAIERAAVSFVRSSTKPESIVQPEPDERPPLLQLTERRFAVANPDDAHVQVFAPKNAIKMREAVAEMRAAFRTTDAARAQATMLHFGVDYVWVGSREREICDDCPQFRDPLRFDAVFEDENVAVFRVLNK